MACVFISWPHREPQCPGRQGGPTHSIGRDFVGGGPGPRPASAVLLPQSDLLSPAAIRVFTVEGGDPRSGRECVLTVYRLFRVLWRHMMLLLVVGALGGAGGIALLRIVPPVYVAEGQILVGFAASRATDYVSGVQSSEEWLMATEQDVLTSPALVARALDRLRLADGFTLPSFAAAVRERLADLPLLPERYGVVSSAEPRLGPEMVRSGLSTELRRSSFVIWVRHRSTDPTFSAELVNALMEVYIEARATRALDLRDALRKALVERLTSLDGELVSVSEAIEVARSEPNSQGRIDRFDQRVQELQSLRNEAQSRLGDLLAFPVSVDSRILVKAEVPAGSSSIRKLLLIVLALLPTLGLTIAILVSREPERIET